MGRDYPATLAPGVQGKFAACSSRLAAPWLPVGAQVSRLALLHTSPGAQQGQSRGHRESEDTGGVPACPVSCLPPLSCLPNTWPTLHGLRHRRKAVCKGSNGGGLQLREGLSGRVGEGRNDAGGVTLDSKILCDWVCVCACPSVQACVCALIPRSPGTAILDPVSP